MTGIEGLKSANALTSQIITISSGLLAFTVTFVEKFVPKGQNISTPNDIKISWFLFIITIFFGFWTLATITGTLDNIDLGKSNENNKRSNIFIPTILMYSSFILALIFLIFAGWKIT